MKTSKKTRFQILMLVVVVTFLYFPGLGCFSSSYTQPKPSATQHPPLERKTLTYPDASRYEGFVLDNQAHGNGMMIYPDGRRYLGVYRHGKHDGPGTMRYPDGHFEKGQWGKDQQFHKF